MFKTATNFFHSFQNHFDDEEKQVNHFQSSDETEETDQKTDDFTFANEQNEGDSNAENTKPEEKSESDHHQTEFKFEPSPDPASNETEETTSAENESATAPSNSDDVEDEDEDEDEDEADFVEDEEEELDDEEEDLLEDEELDEEDESTSEAEESEAKSWADAKSDFHVPHAEHIDNPIEQNNSSHDETVEQTSSEIENEEATMEKTNADEELIKPETDSKNKNGFNLIFIVFAVFIVAIGLVVYYL